MQIQFPYFEWRNAGIPHKTDKQNSTRMKETPFLKDALYKATSRGSGFSFFAHKGKKMLFKEWKQKIHEKTSQFYEPKREQRKSGRWLVRTAARFVEEGGGEVAK